MLVDADRRGTPSVSGCSARIGAGSSSAGRLRRERRRGARARGPRQLPESCEHAAAGELAASRGFMAPDLLTPSSTARGRANLPTDAPRRGPPDPGPGGGSPRWRSSRRPPPLAAATYPPEYHFRTMSTERVSVHFHEAARADGARGRLDRRPRSWSATRPRYGLQRGPRPAGAGRRRRPAERLRLAAAVSRS